MNINHLIYFKEVCMHGSITAASEICHISQPSITSAIQNIEKESGIKLFNRSGNKLILTDEGKEFLKLTHDFLDKYDDFYKSISDISNKKTSVIKLGVPSVLDSFLLNKIIPFKSMYKDIRLEIFETGSISGIGMLRNDELDCMIGLSDEKDLYKIKSDRLFITELQLVISKNHSLSKEKIITREKLIDLPLVIISKGTYHYDAITHMYPDTSLNIIMHSNQISTIREMITSNNAATIIYREVFADCDDIVYIPLEKRITAQVSLFHQSNRYESKALRNFISYIKNQFI